MSGLRRLGALGLGFQGSERTQYPLIKGSRVVGFRASGFWCNAGALTIRIGFWGPLYYTCSQQAPKIVLVIISAPYTKAFRASGLLEMGFDLLGLGF